MSEDILIGGLVTVTGAVVERKADGFLVQYERGGEVIREWFLAEELSPLGFDDDEACMGDGI